jgi:hypothetical protein
MAKWQDLSSVCARSSGNTLSSLISSHVVMLISSYCTITTRIETNFKGMQRAKGHAATPIDASSFKHLQSRISYLTVQPSAINARRGSQSNERMLMLLKLMLIPAHHLFCCAALSSLTCSASISNMLMTAS